MYFFPSWNTPLCFTITFEYLKYLDCELDENSEISIMKAQLLRELSYQAMERCLQSLVKKCH